MVDNASLLSLSITPGNLMPGFRRERPYYGMSLPGTVSSVVVTAEAQDPRAMICVNGNTVASGDTIESIPLEVGINLIRIEVTAAEGTVRQCYEVTVERALPLLNWIKVLDHAPWTIRDSAGALVFNNRMWQFGGYTPQLVSDVWSSADGVTWREHNSIPDEHGINIPLTFVYDGKMWVTTVTGCLYSSADGEQWDLVTDTLPWGTRYASAGVVFKGKMWMLGGKTANEIYNDIWSSTDGIHWTLEVPEAPWSRRQLFGNVVAHTGKLWVIGGGLTIYFPFKAYQDVWCSEDGVTWTQVTDHAPWPARIWSRCAVYRNRIWLLGGFREAKPTSTNCNDVWYSADGAEWHQLVTEDIWEPRHEIAQFVHDDRLWVVGGNVWPLVDDVWQLHIPQLSFISQPVVQEFVNAQYRYQARADFNRSPAPIQYRLLESPEWLSIDQDTGVIAGIPPTTGNFPMVIAASDHTGEEARQAYTLHVIPIL